MLLLITRDADNVVTVGLRSSQEGANDLEQNAGVGWETELLKKSQSEVVL